MSSVTRNFPRSRRSLISSKAIDHQRSQNRSKYKDSSFPRTMSDPKSCRNKGQEGDKRLPDVG